MQTGNGPRMDHIMQVAFGFWSAKVLLSAVEMGIFTELGKGPEDLQTLGPRLGLHPRSARDFLDALVALGFLERKNGQYSNTESTGFFLDKRKPSYAGGLLEMANHRLYGFCRVTILIGGAADGRNAVRRESSQTCSRSYMPIRKGCGDS